MSLSGGKCDLDRNNAERKKKLGFCVFLFDLFEMKMDGTGKAKDFFFFFCLGFSFPSPPSLLLL